MTRMTRMFFCRIRVIRVIHGPHFELGPEPRRTPDHAMQLSASKPAIYAFRVSALESVGLRRERRDDLLEARVVAERIKFFFKFELAVAGAERQRRRLLQHV